MKTLRLGLITRIALLVIGIEIAAFSALGWFYIGRFSSSIEERTYSHLRLVGRMIANDELPVSAIAQPAVMNDLLGEPYLSGMVIGGNGRVIVSTNPAQLGQPAGEVAGLSLGKADERVADQFLNGPGTLTAILRTSGSNGGAAMYTTVVTISTDQLNATKRSIMLWGQLASLLFILLTSAGIVLIAQRLISRRVGDTLAVMKQVEDGNLDARVAVALNDEIGQMQDGINSMTSKLGALLIQARRHAEEIRAKSQLLDSIVENIPNMIFLKRASDLRYTLFNRAGEKLIEMDRKQLLNKDDHEIFSATQADFFVAKDREALRSEGLIDIPEEAIVTATGNKRYLHTKKLALRNREGEAEYLLGIAEDITERKLAEERISELAFFDQLTGLPNRTLLLDRLKQAMLASSRSNSYGALLFIDLDNFKTLNDTLGHDMGDLLLQQVAQRLKSVMRAEDTVGRVGGDEFLVMLTNLGTQESEVLGQVEGIGRKILAILNQSYQLNDNAFVSTPSIGATVFCGQQVAVEELLKQADLAMYKSKGEGRNTLHFFNQEMQSIVEHHAALEKDLRTAIHEGQFSLHYQPQVDNHAKASGAEVLLRWSHPQRGQVSPTEFIPMAESTGLILLLGDWVLRQACSQLVVWAADPVLANLTISVNVSVHQFRQADFVEQVLAILRDTGAPASRLKLELTESMLASNIEDIIGKMQALKAHGVRFSLDDFGTGYSSLSYLRRLPLDQLKIDQSFVQDMLNNRNNSAIARTIVALGHSLELSVVAEGVETREQMEFLAFAGCHVYQGFLFSRPLPLAQFEQYVRQHQG